MSKKDVKYYETTDVSEVETLQKEGNKVIAISSGTPQVFTLDIVDKSKDKEDKPKDESADPADLKKAADKAAKDMAA